MSSLRILSIAIATIATIATLVAADVKDVDELNIETLSKPETGCDRVTKSGDMLTMNYRGTLIGGTEEFDSSYSRNEPFKFQLGVGQVIKGWDKGLMGMCVGEKRKLTIPSKLAYGENGAGAKIPANAGLEFEVECVAIDDPAEPLPNVFSDIDSNADKLLSREEVSEYLKKQLPQAEKAGLKDLPDQDKLVEEIFNHEDVDKNGFISHEEFSGPKHDEL